MNDAHLHIAINHLPIAATLFGVLIGIISMIAKSDGGLKSGLFLLIAAGLLSIPAVETGEHAEEIVERMSLGEDIHDYIHEHEEMAETARWISLGVSLLAMIAVYFNFAKKAPAKLFSVLALAGGLGSTFYLGQVANSGGQIRHTEIRDDFEIPAGDDHGATHDVEEDHHDDD